MRSASRVDVGPSPVGLVLGSVLPPPEIPHLARLGERLGFGELWIPEDYFFTGGIATAAAVLGATDQIPVGLGIVSALVRHPAILAMELATLEAMYPGRLRPGIGLGVPSWMGQMNLVPRSRRSAMRECVTAVRRLLDGEELNETGATFTFQQVKLAHPPRHRVPIYMGVVGPRLLRLSGQVADGTLTSVLAGTRYIEWARKRIALGQADAGRGGPHRVSAFAAYSVDRDARRAKRRVRQLVAFYLAADTENALIRLYGIQRELRHLARGGPRKLQQAMPEAWVDDLAVAGDPPECAAKIQRLLDAGADSVLLFPFPPDDAVAQMEITAAEVLPRLARGARRLGVVDA